MLDYNKLYNLTGKIEGVVFPMKVLTVVERSVITVHTKTVEFGPN